MSQVILVVLDGLRPDFVSEELTPNLVSLAAEGIVFRNHHACFPSVTRVNSTSIATGCHPGNHGIVDNTLYLPKIQTDPINTGNHTHLRALDRATAGGLLSATTLTELLGAAGRQIAVVTTSSSGACFLQNHRGIGLTVNGDFIDPPAASERIEARFGPAPAKVAPAIELSEWAGSIITDYVLPELHPDLAIVWLCDPDKTQHTYGLGAAESLSAIQSVDTVVGQIAGALEKLGTRDSTNLIVMSDHGWVSYRDRLNVKSALVAAGVKQSPDSRDIRVVGQGVYIHPECTVSTEEIVDYLHRMDEIGAVFTRKTMDSAIPYSEIGYDHPRSPDILFSPAWDEATNAYGVPGMAFGGGPGGHGGSSPYEMRTFLTAKGPGFLSGTEIHSPTGHVDLLPTILHLLDQAPAANKDGRILLESLADNGSEIHSSSDTRTASCGPKRIVLHREKVGTTPYFHFASASIS